MALRSFQLINLFIVTPFAFENIHTFACPDLYKKITVELFLNCNEILKTCFKWGYEQTYYWSSMPDLLLVLTSHDLTPCLSCRRWDEWPDGRRPSWRRWPLQQSHAWQVCTGVVTGWERERVRECWLTPTRSQLPSVSPEWLNLPLIFSPSFPPIILSFFLFSFASHFSLLLFLPFCFYFFLTWTCLSSLILYLSFHSSLHNLLSMFSVLILPLS